MNEKNREEPEAVYDPKDVPEGLNDLAREPGLSTYASMSRRLIA